MNKDRFPEHKKLYAMTDDQRNAINEFIEFVDCSDCYVVSRIINGQEEYSCLKDLYYEMLGVVKSRLADEQKIMEKILRSKL